MSKLNPYYKGTKPMQDIIHNQTEEVIRQYGREFQYVPRADGKYDFLFGEDQSAKFEKAFPIQAYLNGSESYGDTDMLSRFGLTVKDECRIILASRHFQQTTKMKHPIEGDLIFDPTTRRLFEIKHVENEDVFYQLEQLPQFNLKLELFEYSHEQMDTGIREVDMLDGIDNSEGEYTELTEQDNESINEALLDLANGSVVNKWDLDSDNPEEIHNWDEKNPFA